MANATPADARAGWEVFRASGFEASLDDINHSLVAAGYGRISPRMYRHYHNLASAGYNRYISINRFDVERASQPYESLSSNARYRYFDARAGVRVTFPRGRRLVEAYGRADRVGETGLMLIFDTPEVVAALQKSNKPRLGETVRIDFLDPPRQVDGRILEVEAHKADLVLEVEFTRLQSIAEYVGRTPLQLSRHSIRLIPMADQPDTVDVIGRQLFYLFEVVEAGRAFVNEAARLSSNTDAYAPVARVESLRMSSPLVAILGVPTPVALAVASGLGLLSLAAAWERWRKQRLENNSREVDLQVQRAKAKVEEKKAELQVQILNQAREQFTLTDEHAEEIVSLADRQLFERVIDLSQQQVERAEVRELPSAETD